MQERFDKKFFNPAIPSPSQLKSFISSEILLAQREMLYKVEKFLTIDVTKAKWVENAKPWKMGVEPCMECENSEKIITLLSSLSTELEDNK